MESSNLLLNFGNYYLKEMTDELLKRGSFGDICLHYYGENVGALISNEEDPVISRSVAQLKACSRVAAVAGGV
jgi:DNA-binding transcriptional regulator LsrR (DeoR family)